MKCCFFSSLFLLVVHNVLSQNTYIFTGNGLWSDSTNWAYNTVPPLSLPPGNVIYLNTQVGDSCVIDVNQVISTNAILNSNRTKIIIQTGVTVNLAGAANIYLSNDSMINCNREWSARNLDVTTYRNGDPIPLITDATLWRNATYGAYCYMNNDPANAAEYGPLYNWYAVNDPRGLVPAGWHIPSMAEWNELFDCLGGWDWAGGRMKETGTIHWQTPNFGATNISGFTGLPGGYRNFQGTFGNFTGYGYWWGSTTNASDQAYHFYLSYGHGQALQGFFEKTWGFSVRCVRD